jgi:hypothetical protein
MSQGPDTQTRPKEPLIPRRSSYWTMRKMIDEQGYQHHDGYHLCSEGLYRETVTAMCIRNPLLRWGHIQYAATPDEYGRVVVLEFVGAALVHVSRINLTSSRNLSTYLQQEKSHSTRRLFLMEGVARNYVEVLGSHFNMDPSFFASQKRPNSWELSQFNIERTQRLPSLNDPRRSFMMRYPEMRYFPLKNGRSQLNDQYLRDVEGQRTINISRRTREIKRDKDLKWGQFDNIAVINRAASYWSRKYQDGGWEGLDLIHSEE